MAIIQSINSHSAFADAFQRMGRGSQFTYSALGALFDFYDELGEDVMLDPIAICCDWSEYDSALEAALALGYQDNDTDLLEDRQEALALGWLNDRTTVLATDDGHVVFESF